MKNLAGLMKQASQMQAKMQELQDKMQATEVTGAAGAGMVTVTMTGKNELRAIRVDPKLADPNEMEMLQDLIVAAHADAKRQIEELTEAELKQATGGLNIPGMKLPF